MKVRRLPIPAGVIVAIGGLTYPLYLLHQHIGYMLLNTFAGRGSPGAPDRGGDAGDAVGLVAGLARRRAADAKMAEGDPDRGLHYFGAQMNVTAAPAGVPAPRDDVVAATSGGRRPALARAASPA